MKTHFRLMKLCYYFVTCGRSLPRPRQNIGHLNKILVPILKTQGNIVYIFTTRPTDSYLFHEIFIFK